MAKVMEREAKETKQSKRGKDLHTLINQQVANWAVLDIKIHQHHWFVKGPQFYALHIKFEELYNEAALNMDELAERLLALGGSPVSTTKEFTEFATVKEHAPLKSADDMVQSLCDDFSMMIEETGEAMEVAEKEGDEGTHDMLNELRTQLQKHVWMMKAYLGK